MPGPDRARNEPAPLDATAGALAELLLAGDQFRQAIAEHLQIGVTETIALSQLGNAGPMTARELSRRIGLTPSTVTSVLDRLQVAGLADRAAHPTDRRQIVISLTSKGKKSLAWTQVVLADVTRTIETGQLPLVGTAMIDLAAELRRQTVVLKGA
jgi:DNA-binding MarR family transcriptional regulator